MDHLRGNPRCMSGIQGLSMSDSHQTAQLDRRRRRITRPTRHLTTSSSLETIGRHENRTPSRARSVPCACAEHRSHGAHRRNLPSPPAPRRARAPLRPQCDAPRLQRGASERSDRHLRDLPQPTTKAISSLGNGPKFKLPGVGSRLYFTTVSTQSSDSESESDKLSQQSSTES